jgi:hypothetical protein
MRHAGMIFALLAAGTQLTACATAGSPGALQGQAGVVAWEIVDTKQTLEENGFRMRWDFTLVFKDIARLPSTSSVWSTVAGPADRSMTSWAV